MVLAIAPTDATATEAGRLTRDREAMRCRRTSTPRLWARSLPKCSAVIHQDHHRGQDGNAFQSARNRLPMIQNTRRCRASCGTINWRS